VSCGLCDPYAPRIELKGNSVSSKSGAKTGKSSGLDSIFDVIKVKPETKIIYEDCGAQGKYLNYKNKALFGFVYGSFGFMMVLTLVCI